MYCSTLINVPTHMCRHFLHNNSHFICLDRLLNVYCFKCKRYIKTSELDVTSQEKYAQICRILACSLEPATSPPVLAALANESVAERAGKKVDLMKDSSATPHGEPKESREEPPKEAKSPHTPPRREDPLLFIGDTGEEEAKEANHREVPASPERLGLIQRLNSRLSSGGRRSPDAPKERATVSHTYSTIVLSPLANERSSVYVKSEKLVYVSPASSSPGQREKIRGLRAHPDRGTFCSVRYTFRLP